MHWLVSKSDKCQQVHLSKTEDASPPALIPNGFSQQLSNMIWNILCVICESKLVISNSLEVLNTARKL